MPLTFLLPTQLLSNSHSLFIGELKPNFIHEDFSVWPHSLIFLDSALIHLLEARSIVGTILFSMSVSLIFIMFLSFYSPSRLFYAKFTFHDDKQYIRLIYQIILTHHQTGPQTALNDYLLNEKEKLDCYSFYRRDKVIEIIL